ncbi:hypothetical protein [Spongiactinospora rosea]|uniref:hypothetical protein n=1 Tax=Spongiactinospora rosea TaxID=2248750 RepID=UPI0011C03149|nr:hypothetical protein [Spongiactinospora rosea]
MKLERERFMSRADDYEAVMPQVQAYLERYGRAFEAVRVPFRGWPREVVREVLVEAFKTEGIEVWREVIEDAARLISEGEG